MKNKTLLIFGIISLLIIFGVVTFLSLNSKPSLENSSWKLEAWYISYLNLDKVDITLNFDDGKIGGNGGVNSYGGSYKFSVKNKIEFYDIISTEMASLDPEINEIESSYFELLVDVRYYELSINKLILYDGNNNQILVFNK